MSRVIRVPVKVIRGEEWGDLNALSIAHEIVGEQIHIKDSKHSHAGGHRVRIYHFKKNVYWRTTTGMDLNITEVDPVDGPPPRRRNR